MRHFRLINIIGVARGHVSELFESDLIGMRQVGEKFAELGVQADFLLVDHFQEHG